MGEDMLTVGVWGALDIAGAEAGAGTDCDLQQVADVSDGGLVGVGLEHHFQLQRMQRNHLTEDRGVGSRRRRISVRA